MKKSILAVSVLMLVGCGDETTVVKEAFVNDTGKYTYDAVLSNRPVCTDITWKPYETDGVKYVEYVCSLKAGNVLPVYNEDEKEKVGKDATIREVGNALLAYEKVLNTGNEAINHASSFVEANWDEVEMVINGGHNTINNIYNWKFETVKMNTIIDHYLKTTPEGLEYNENVRKERKLRLLSGIDRHAEDRKLAVAVIPLYIEKIKELLKEKEAAFLAYQEELPESSKNYVNSEINNYINTHPMNYKEKIIWSWNKLDKKYEVNESDVEITWPDGRVEKTPLCLSNIVYSVTHNLNTIDKYNEYAINNKFKCVE